MTVHVQSTTAFPNTRLIEVFTTPQLISELARELLTDAVEYHIDMVIDSDAASFDAVALEFKSITPQVLNQFDELVKGLRESIENDLANLKVLVNSFTIKSYGISDIVVDIIDNT